MKDTNPNSSCAIRVCFSSFEVDIRHFDEGVCESGMQLAIFTGKS